jgi:HSP20 family protein
MRRDDRDDPFDDIFREIERMMNDMMGGDFDVQMEAEGGPSYSTDTHVDVQEYDDEIRVVADIPGVEKDEITLKCDGKALTIRAESERRSYDEHVALPTAVDEHSASATYNNGVLEVVLEKTEDSADIDIE